MPPVILVGSAGPGSACLVVGTVGAVPLVDLDPLVVTDELLTAIWEGVALLHRARIAHGLLDAGHVVVSPDGPWIVGFDDARATVSDQHRGFDVAELLAATAAIVGEERATRVAVGVLGRDRVATALPFLQPAVLTRSTRDIAGGRRSDRVRSLTSLRDAGAAAANVPTPELQRMRRIDPVNAGMAVGGLVAVAILLDEVGDPSAVWDTVRSTNWAWIAVALLFSFSANVGFAIGLMGTVPVRLPLWPTTEVQVAMSFSNLAVPAIGGQGMQIRYLQQMGVDLPSAIAAGGPLSSVGNLVAVLGLFVIAVVIEPSRANLSLLPTTGLIELTAIVVAVVAIASAAVMSVPRVRHAAIPPIRRAATTMQVVLRSPRRLTLLIGGYALATLLSTWCLQACLVAFGGSVSYWSLLAANIGVMTVASIVPIPGGGTAVGTVGLSAILVSFGVPEEVAVATALMNQLVYYYFPAIPGWFATKHLFRHDYL